MNTNIMQDFHICISVPLKKSGLWAVNILFEFILKRTQETVIMLCISCLFFLLMFFIAISLTKKSFRLFRYFQVILV